MGPARTRIRQRWRSLAASRCNARESSGKRRLPRISPSRWQMRLFGQTFVRCGVAHSPLTDTVPRDMCRPYSASDLRRLFASVKGQNGVSKSGRSGKGSASLASRAAGGLERLIARILHGAPPQSASSPARRRSLGAAPTDGSPTRRSPQRIAADLDINGWAV